VPSHPIAVDGVETPVGDRPVADPPGWRLGVACAAFAALLALVWSVRPLAHDDVFWHLRTGDWILAHHAVPTRDPFSYTRLGAPWISHEWGFAMVAWTWDHAFGLRGLQALTVLITALAGALVLRRAAAPGARTRWQIAGPLLGIALLASGPALFLRPAYLALVLLAALLLALDRFHRTGRRVFLVAALGSLWLWANVHSNVVFGLGLLALQTAEAWWMRRRQRPLGPAERPDDEPARSADAGRAAPALTVTLGVACVLALCNPNGVRALLFAWILRHILWDSGIAWDLGQFETQSPLANPPLLLFAALLVFVLLRWRRSPGAFRPWEAAASLLYLGLAFSASRFVPELAVVALPVLIRGLSGVSVEQPRAAPLLAAGVAVVLALVGVQSLPAWPPPTVDASFPDGAVRFLRFAGLHGRLFHNSNQGGYLLWSLGDPVFWDGRTDVFASLTREVTTIPFPQVVARYGVDSLLLGERELRDLRAEAESERWGLVYWDDTAAVYLRRDGPLGPRLAELELKSFHGLTDGSELAAIAADPARRAAGRAELARLLAEQPRNRRALYFAAVLELADGAPAKARELLRSALALGGNDAVKQALALAEAMLAKNPQGAR